MFSFFLILRNLCCFRPVAGDDQEWNWAVIESPCVCVLVTTSRLKETLLKVYSAPLQGMDVTSASPAL